MSVMTMPAAKRDPRQQLHAMRAECAQIQLAFRELDRENRKLRRRLLVALACLLIALVIISGLLVCMLHHLEMFR